MFQRKLLQPLSSLLLSSDSILPILCGADSVGKSTLIWQIASSHFPNFIRLSLHSAKTLKAECDAIRTPAHLLRLIEDRKNRKETEAKPLVYFEEVHESPTLLKWLDQLPDFPQYRFIASTSQPHLLPEYPSDKVKKLTMHPLDFEEFLTGYGVPPELLDYYRSQTQKRQPITTGGHNVLMNIFKTYLCYGGCPAYAYASIKPEINAYLQSALKTLKDFIYKPLIQMDKAHNLKCAAIYDYLISTLDKKPNSRIRFRDIEKKSSARYSTYEPTLNAMITDGLLIPMYGLSDLSTPTPTTDKKLMKLTLNDPATLKWFLSELTDDSLKNEIPDFRHASIYECAIAANLHAYGIKLFYCNHRQLGEADFMVYDQERLGWIAITPHLPRPFHHQPQRPII